MPVRSAYPILGPLWCVKNRERETLPPERSLSFPDLGRNALIPVEAACMIEVSRTLMKSEPELAELIREVEGVEVTMAEKGFGTRVAIRASEETGLEAADLEAVLDRLAEPQRRPFS
jgi:hypothetical protein